MQEDTEMKTSSLLWKEKQKEDDNGECSGDGTSSVTFMLIFSTFICAVGSFLSGNAVSLSEIIPRSIFLSFVSEISS